jgi:hypothetical protein
MTLLAPPLLVNKTCLHSSPVVKLSASYHHSSTHPVTEMNARNISLGGGGERQPVLRADNFTIFMCCHEILEPQAPGTVMACPGQYRYCFYQNSYRATLPPSQRTL